MAIETYAQLEEKLAQRNPSVYFINDVDICFSHSPITNSGNFLCLRLKDCLYWNLGM